MDQAISVTITKGNSMDLVFWFTLMTAHIEANGTAITWVVRVRFHGPMAARMKEPGIWIKRMVLVKWYGLMVEFTMATSTTISVKDKAHRFSKMDQCIRANLYVTNNMEKAQLCLEMDKRELESGILANFVDIMINNNKCSTQCSNNFRTIQEMHLNFSSHQITHKVGKECRKKATL